MKRSKNNLKSAARVRKGFAVPNWDPKINKSLNLEATPSKKTILNFEGRLGSFLHTMLLEHLRSMGASLLLHVWLSEKLHWQISIFMPSFSISTNFKRLMRWWSSAKEERAFNRNNNFHNFNSSTHLVHVNCNGWYLIWWRKIKGYCSIVKCDWS